MSVEIGLKALLKALLEEVRVNPDARRRIGQALKEAGEASARDLRRRGVAAAPKAAESVSDEVTPEASIPAASGRANIDLYATYRSGGEDGLSAKLLSFTLQQLRALVADRRLDPAGKTDDADKRATVAHIVLSVQRKIERDRKMFAD
jgi:hypothetical protein